MTNRSDLTPIDVQLQAVSRASLPPSADPNQTQPTDSPESSIKVVSALPSAGIRGRLVFLTTNKKLYRDDGTQWTVATDGADILAGTVTAAQIAAGTITAAQIAAGTITGTQIAAATVTASNLSVSQLSAITADMGTLTAGKIQNAGATAGVKLSGALPGGWTRYLDLDSADTTFLKHDKLSLNYDGSAVFNGNLRSLVGGSTTTAPAVQMLFQNTNVASGTGADHSVTSFSLPASALQNNGDSVRINVWLHGGGNGDAINVKFGATVVGSTSLLASSVMYFSILVTRTGASAQRASAFVTTNNALNTQQASPAETLSGAITIDFRTGNSVAITFDAITIEYLGA